MKLFRIKDFQSSSDIIAKKDETIDMIIQDFIRLQKPLDEFPDYLKNQINKNGFACLLGKLTGYTVGKAIAKLIAKVLGVKTDGLFYKILTNSFVGAAIGDIYLSEK